MEHEQHEDIETNLTIQEADLLEVIELDERLDLTVDPLMSFSNACCSNGSNCGC